MQTSAHKVNNNNMSVRDKPPQLVESTPSYSLVLFICVEYIVTVMAVAIAAAVLKAQRCA
eukprot:2800-Heterococcus_DN1.PRE.2